MADIVFDLEANGLLQDATVIHCICWKYLDSDKIEWTQDPFTFLDLLDKDTQLIGHNIIGYDIPVIRKITGYDKEIKLLDTYVLSRLLFPDLSVPKNWKGPPKPHSLEAWAMRLGGVQKQYHDSWNEFSEEMLARCKKDVQITDSLYKWLNHELRTRN